MFCTLDVSSLKMNLFYKIHLQIFNVISVVLYHSGPTFGQVLYPCQDAFVVDASDYLVHLIRHLLNASGLMSGLYGGWGSTCHPYFSKISDTAPEAWARVLSLSDSSQFHLPFQGSVLQNWDHLACQYAHNIPYRSLALNCRENQNDCIILLAAQAQCAELLKWPTYSTYSFQVASQTQRESIAQM
jgi:hypothetical protein